MDAFKQKVTEWYHKCPIKNCSCCTLAYNSEKKKQARRLARTRLKRELKMLD